MFGTLSMRLGSQRMRKECDIKFETCGHALSLSLSLFSASGASVVAIDNKIEQAMVSLFLIRVICLKLACLSTKTLEILKLAHAVWQVTS